MLDTHAEKVKINLKKVKGQVELIEKMIDEKRYCIEVAQQINAALGLLKQANSVVLENHLLTCGTNRLASKNKKVRQAFVKELVKVFSVTNR